MMWEVILSILVPALLTGLTMWLTKDLGLPGRRQEAPEVDPSQAIAELEEWHRQWFAHQLGEAPHPDSSVAESNRWHQRRHEAERRELLSRIHTAYSEVGGGPWESPEERIDDLRLSHINVLRREARRMEEHVARHRNIQERAKRSVERRGKVIHDEPDD